LLLTTCPAVSSVAATGGSVGGAASRRLAVSVAVVIKGKADADEAA
jgi:hypothetical protein